MGTVRDKVLKRYWSYKTRESWEKERWDEEKRKERLRRIVQKMLDNPVFRRDLDELRAAYQTEQAKPIGERDPNFLVEPIRKIRSKYGLGRNWAIWIGHYVRGKEPDSIPLLTALPSEKRDEAGIPKLGIEVFPEMSKADWDHLWRTVSVLLADHPALPGLRQRQRKRAEFDNALPHFKG